MSAGRLMQFYADREPRPFPRVPALAPSASVLLASAVRDLDNAVPSLILAANEAPSRMALIEQQQIIAATIVQLEAVIALTKDLAFRKFPRFTEGVVDGEA